MQFTKEKVPSIAGGNQWVFMEHAPDKSPESKFTIIADRFGIKFRGESPTIESRSDLDSLARVISDAWSAHMRLKPALSLAKE